MNNSNDSKRWKLVELRQLKHPSPSASLMIWSLVSLPSSLPIHSSVSFFPHIPFHLSPHNSFNTSPCGSNQLAPNPETFPEKATDWYGQHQFVDLQDFNYSDYPVQRDSTIVSYTYMDVQRNVMANFVRPPSPLQRRKVIPGNMPLAYIQLHTDTKL